MDLSVPLAHPALSECEVAVRQVAGWALNHFATLSEQSVGRTATPAELGRLLGEPAPEAGRPFGEVLERFERDVAPYALHIMHPRFLAFVPGAPSFPSVLGDWLTAAANFFAGVWLEAAGPSQMELTVLDWFKQWLGYPPTAGGLFTSGGSEANLTALVVARETLSWEDRGRAVLYVSAQRHSSADRAAKVIGLHRAQICAMPEDAHLRLRAEALREAVRADRAAGRLPWAVVTNAGATNTGTVDPLEELADCCRDERLWLHVDAAYGWAAVLTGEGQRELAGIGRADSVTLDPHKWLAQTFDAGCLLVRDSRQLRETFATRPDYLQDVEPQPGEVNFADHGIALTRRFRALKVWVSVQTLGLGWFRALAERCCRLADYAQRQLEAAGCFEVLCPRQLSIVCFRFVGDAPSWQAEEGVRGTGPANRGKASSSLNQEKGSAGSPLDALNERLARELLATGRAFLSSTRLRGVFALRMCFINWRTTSRDVDEVIGLLRELGERVSRAGPEASHP